MSLSPVPHPASGCGSTTPPPFGTPRTHAHLNLVEDGWERRGTAV